MQFKNNLNPKAEFRAMYRVIGSIDSRASRVLWMLEELGQPYEHVAAKPRSAEAIAANPSGKVPVLYDGDTAISDSTAILHYLADKHGAMTYPAGTIERALQDSFTFFLLDEFDACLWAAARHSFILPTELRVPAVKDTLKWELQRSQKALVARMGDGPFLMGERMTVPDIVLTSCLGWAKAAKFPIAEQHLGDYLDRMRARPAYLRAMSH